MNAALVQFRKEVTNFYVIAILNIVFSALAMAFGISSIVSAVLGNAPDGGLPALRIVSGAFALICFGLGLSWLRSTVEIFDGVDSIRDILCTKDQELSDDRATCQIIRMLAHYRDNRKTIGTMILVCTLGGCAFFILGITTGLQAVSVFSMGMSVTLDAFLVIPAMLLTLGIAFVSLLSSYYFSRFSRVWDERLHEIDASECALQEKLGDGQ